MSDASATPPAKSTSRFAEATRVDAVDPDELDLLAQVAWRREGCPADRRAACRHEVEVQLRATRTLLVDDLARRRGARHP